MRKLLRILVEVAAPPLFGALLLGIPAVIIEARDPLQLLGLLVTAAYLLGTVPSIGYAVCMEVAFAGGLDPKNKKTVALSALLGFLAGLVMVPLASGGDFIKIKSGALACIPPTGLIVGLLVGALVRVIETKHAKAKPAAQKPAATAPSGRG